MGAYAGVDWASEAHAACVVDETGRVTVERVVGHDERGVAELCDLLVGEGVQRVALERPDGVLVERLVDAGLVVLAIHPNQVRAARERYTVARTKSDRLDAFVLGELARTDAHRFRALRPDSDETKALRALTRAREDLVAARVRLANELRAELERFWPGAARIFSEVDSPIALAFCERYPSPADARGLGERRLEGFLARERYCGRRSAGELLSRLRQAATGTAGEAEVEAHRSVVLALVAALRPLVEQIGRLSSQIAGAVRAHVDGEIFLSLFRDPRSTVTAARLAAEIGDCRGRPRRRGPGRRRRHEPGRDRVGQAQGRRLSSWLRSPAARRRGLPGRRDAPPPSLGAAGLRQGPRSWLRPSTRHPGPRARLAARDLADVAGPPCL